MRPRTKRQRQILDFINSYVESHGHDPSYSQIAVQLGVRSKSGIAKHIEALESQGHLTRIKENGHFRLELNPSESFEELVCRINWLSLPDDATETPPDYDLYVPKFMIGGIPHQKLRGYLVQNDAMLDSHIRTGDIALIEKKTFARDNDCIVAIAPEGEVVMSSFRRSGAKIEFVPSNERYDTRRFTADEISILGIYRGLMRPAI